MTSEEYSLSQMELFESERVKSYQAHIRKDIPYFNAYDLENAFEAGKCGTSSLPWIDLAKDLPSKNSYFVVALESGVFQGSFDKDGQLCVLCGLAWRPIDRKGYWIQLPQSPFDRIQTNRTKH